MNYIVISPYYPQNFQQFTVELANKGITVLGIGQEPYDQLDQPLKNSLILDKFARLTDYSIQTEILCFQRLLTMLIPL